MKICCLYCGQTLAEANGVKTDVAALRALYSVRCFCRLSPEVLRGLLAGDGPALVEWRAWRVKCLIQAGISAEKAAALASRFALRQEDRMRIHRALRWLERNNEGNHP